jgi:hypothetical protein
MSSEWQEKYYQLYCKRKYSRRRKTTWHSWRNPGSWLQAKPDTDFGTHYYNSHVNVDYENNTFLLFRKRWNVGWRIRKISGKSK